LGKGWNRREKVKRQQKTKMRRQFYISQGAAWLCGDCASENRIWPLSNFVPRLTSFNRLLAWPRFQSGFVSSGALVEVSASDSRHAPSIFPNPISRKNIGLQLASIFGLLVLAFAARAQRPLGTDVSGYQPNVDWVATKNGGVTFAWAKATEGASFTNSVFFSQEAGAHAAGIYIGAYHFARPSINTNITGRFSADTEAAFFWSVAGDYIKSANGYLVPMLDWEDPNAVNGFHGITGFTTAYMSAWVNEWCNSVSNFAQLNGVTIRPIVYTGTWYSNPANGYPGLDDTVTNWPAWLAYYPNSPNAQSGAPPSTYPWPTWTVWQYADTNWSGGDADVFNGTADGLGALVIGGLDTPPYIFAQTMNDLAADTGEGLHISAAAGGKGLLNYQWMFNGAKISGATNTTLSIASAQLTNAGNYSVIVSNTFGSVTSSIVSLTVYPPQAIVFSDDFETNSAGNWNINKSSADTAIAFSFDYSTLGIPSAPHSLGGTTRGVQMKANLASGAVAALSISPANKNFAGDYRLHFDGWINVNGPFPNGGTGSTEYLTAGIGSAGNRTEWTGSGSTADGFYFSADGEGGVNATSTTTGDYATYTGTTLVGTSSGAYRAGTGTDARDNANAYYTAALGVGQAAPPLQQSSYAQQTGTLNNGTFGFAWHDVIVSRRGSTVDWIIDGVRMATISNATFTASNVFVGFWDPFASLSDNNSLSFGLVDNVRVEVPAVAPVITTNPAPQIVKLGTNVTFTAAASGLPAPSFQWRFNGTNISGMTNSILTIASALLTNGGNYSVVATNLVGSVVSADALLSFVPPMPAQFQNFAEGTNGLLQINFTGDAYWPYVVETSTDLLHWSALTNIASTNGLFQFTDSTTNGPQLFYRARVTP
jgi:GH25 family lysozyme M1 (1,4-beta-N-acetylmuramidase)